MDFIIKLAALIPPLRAHLTRSHGVFARNAALGAQLTPSGPAAPVEVSGNDVPRGHDEKRHAMRWAQLHKRVLASTWKPAHTATAR